MHAMEYFLTMNPQNEEKILIKLRYTSKLNSVKLKVIHKGPSLSITKFLYLEQVQNASFSNNLQFDVSFGNHTLTIVLDTSDGIDLSIEYLSIYKWQNDRIYFTAETNEVKNFQMTNAIDNYFSPLLFENFIGYGHCDGDKDWHKLKTTSGHTIYNCNEGDHA